MFSSLVALAVAAQLPIGFQRSQLASESALSAIGDEVFTTLSLPEFTDHSVRIKKTTHWCDPDTRSYTGYIDSGPRHRSSSPSPPGPAHEHLNTDSVHLQVFFYYFDSRRDPKSDDFILWTNGGPGCSVRALTSAGNVPEL